MNPSVDGLLTRLKGLALRPLWTEEAARRDRRRCRALVATPFAALGGLAWGVFAAPVMGVGTPLLWGALGAFTLPFFFYLEQRLIPPLARLTARLTGVSGGITALGWDAALVGGLVYLLTSVLGAPLVPAAGTALGIGAFYAFVMEYVICGSAASDVATLIRGPALVASRRRPGLSGAEALERRGDHEAAIRIYEDALADDPREASTYVRLARALAGAGTPDEAVVVLRRGFVRAALTPDQEAFFVRQIHELCSRRLGDPARSADDLELLLERQPEGRHAEWARRALAEIEGRAPDGG